MHFARYGLSGPKFNVLVHLYMAGDCGLIQSELSKKLLVSRANITGILERLEKEELIVRTSDPADKRVTRVCLSERAASLVHTFLPIHNEYMYKVMSALDMPEKETLIKLAKKLKQGLAAL